jgi:hypothetical protein
LELFDVSRVGLDEPLQGGDHAETSGSVRA